MTPAVPTPSSIPLIDLKSEYGEIQDELRPLIEEVFRNGNYILGAHNAGFEQELASYCGVPYATGVNSGTDAILLALRALDIHAGDEVILPAMTFFATAEPIVQLGAKPVFADIDPQTFTLDPKSVESKMTSKTKLIIPVHLYGQMADMDSLLSLTQKRKLSIVEDMAQAIGATYNAKKAGSFGHLAALSFFPTKNLGACGDAGAVLATSAELHEKVRLLRNHGAKVKYEHTDIGYNSRLDELQAAVLRVKLKRLDQWNEKRRAHADFYQKTLKGLPITLPKEPNGRKHVYHLFSIQTDRREALFRHLESKGIATAVHYPKPLHLQDALKSLGYRQGDFPVSEKLAAQTLSLPIYPQLSQDALQEISTAVHSFFSSK